MWKVNLPDFTWKFIRKLDNIFNKKQGDDVTEDRHDTNSANLIKGVTFLEGKVGPFLPIDYFYLKVYISLIDVFAF